MIQTSDLVLILDTNILLEIIDGQKSSRIDQIFSGWIQALCREIDPPPEGKIVTIAVSGEIIDDYRAGLHHRRYTPVAKTLKIIFNRSFSDVVSTGEPGRVRLMLEKVSPGKSEPSRRVRDPYDRRFLDALIHVAEGKRWKSRQIILASVDQKFLQDAERALASRNDKRIHIAPDMNTFRHMFAC